MGQDFSFSLTPCFKREIRSLRQGQVWRGILSWPKEHLAKVFSILGFLHISGCYNSNSCIVPTDILYLKKKILSLKQIIRCLFWRNFNYPDEQTFPARTTPSPRFYTWQKREWQWQYPGVACSGERGETEAPRWDRTASVKARKPLEEEGEALSWVSGCWRVAGDTGLIKKGCRELCLLTIPLNVYKLSKSWNFCSR